MNFCDLDHNERKRKTLLGPTKTKELRQGQYLKKLNTISMLMQMLKPIKLMVQKNWNTPTTLLIP